MISNEKSRRFASASFVDVGQGTSTVVIFQEASWSAPDAIIIDCPDECDRVIKILSDAGVRKVHLLAFSHNHSDHASAAAAKRICREFEVGTFAFVEDRPPKQMKRLKLFSFLAEQRNEARLLKLEKRFITLASNSGLLELLEKGHIPIKVRVLFPDVFDNIELREKAAKDLPNRTCAVFRVDYDENETDETLESDACAILLSSDIQSEGWHSIHENIHGRIKQHYDVMTVPHHGGISLGSKANPIGYDSIYKDIVTADYAVVSFGYNNKHGHPFPAHLAAIREYGAKVICNQLAGHCIPPGHVVDPGYGGSIPAGGRIGHQCGGDIHFLMDTRELRTSTSNHSEYVDLIISANGKPLCRSSSVMKAD